MSETAGPPARIHWQVELRPHRSLPPQGFLVLMLCLAAVSFVSGVMFVMMGAWPVCGFFGLDVGLVYLAFRLNYRSARMRESLCLADDDFTVTRVSVRGEVRFWRFQAFWLKIRLIQTGTACNRLLLTSHGRTIAVAGFLNPDERAALADEVSGALDRWRAAPA